MTQASIASPPLTARPLRCRNCGAERAAAPIAICEECLGPLDPVYEPAPPLPARETIAGRAPSLWRYKEWLPFDGDPVWSLDTGFTPLVDAPALARRFGVARVWVKNDTVSHPSLSFKDRVVAAAINAAAAFGLDTIGCASTGNLANAVAAHAARAGLTAWIFIPEELETAKVVGTSVYGSRPARPGWSRAVCLGCTALRRRAARRSCGWSSAAASSSRSCHAPSAARSRSATPRTGRSPRGRFGRPAVGPRRSATPSSSRESAFSRRTPAFSRRRRAASPPPPPWRSRGTAGSGQRTRSSCA